jgi:hypothetical protein
MVSVFCALSVGVFELCASEGKVVAGAGERGDGVVDLTVTGVA